MKHPLSIPLALALATTLGWSEEESGLIRVNAVAGEAQRLQRESGKVPDDWRAALPEPVLGAHPEWVDFYYDTWRIADLKKAEHGGHTIFDTAFKPGRIWLWDTVWISHFGVYAQGANPPITDPMAGFDLFYSAQREDGCIPHVWDGAGEHSYKVHNPIFTLGELNYYLHTGDKSRLATVLPKLDRFYLYLKQTFGEPDGLYRNFDWHNGMDNRPMSDISIDSTCEQTMVAEHLKQISELVGDEARDIAINGLAGMYQTWAKTGTLWENYDQETPGKPGEKAGEGKICRTDFVGWSGVQPIATLIETIIGIQTNAPENRIEWDLRLTEQNGVRNLRWGKNYSQRVDLVADARTSSGDDLTLTVSSNAPFTLMVDTGFTKKELAIEKGLDQTFVVKR